MLPSAPIAKLPAELLQAIADNLDIEEYLNLRRSCPLAWFSLKPPALSLLLELEFSAFAIEHKVLACHLCCRLRPLSKFADDIVHRGVHKRSRPERFCIECGISGGFKGYSWDDWAMVNGEMHARCPVCRELGGVGRRWRWDSGEGCCARPPSQDVLK
ncbi:MAG: hypothetical protein ALECFALPRED_002160 [Alectoria fallacina]|uniref:F-box domain-containing protein n=1 Tax=Alectoria fallacina TaxID=1903189 RepID=A0A8H3EIG6_9LECA|nr:MAG: hypothetical protein ALECFALPRED_002160 [Alectoria fallacina]